MHAFPMTSWNTHNRESECFLGEERKWGVGREEELGERGGAQPDTSEGHFFSELGQIKKEASKSDVQTTFPV